MAEEDQATPPADAPSGESWFDGLNDELKGDESLKSFENVDALAKEYLSLKNAQIKLPEKPEDYEITVPEGADLDDGAVSQFKSLAHELGIAPETAQKLIDFDVERSKALAESYETAVNKELSAAETALKSEWGNDYDANLKDANKAVKQFGGDDFVKFLADSGMGRNPMVVKVFYAIGKALNEDTPPSPDKGPTDKRQKDNTGRPMLTFKS